jgi:hypothetical protein
VGQVEAVLWWVEQFYWLTHGLVHTHTGYKVGWKCDRKSQRVGRQEEHQALSIAWRNRLLPSISSIILSKGTQFRHRSLPQVGWLQLKQYPRWVPLPGRMNWMPLQWQQVKVSISWVDPQSLVMMA